MDQNMLPKTAILAILSSSFFCSVSALSSGDMMVRSFNQAYEAYIQFEAQGDFINSLPEAKTALEIGEKILQEGEEELPILTYNYGSNLLQLKQYEEAQPVLKKALQRYKSYYGEDSPELISVLMDLGKTETTLRNSRSRDKYYRRALKLSADEYGNKSSEYGWHLTEAGSTIMNLGYGDDAGQYLYKGHRILQATLGDDHVRTGYAAFHIAKFEIRNNKLNQARDHLLLALDSFENPREPSNKLEMSTHAFLVRVYEELGNSKQATEHCLAIGRMTPHAEGDDPVILFSAPIIPPREAIRKGGGGEVTIEFDIDEFGIVRNPEVVALSGNPALGPAWLEAIGKFRYAPKFVDGKAVPVLNTQQVMTFTVERRAGNSGR